MTAVEGVHVSGHCYRGSKIMNRFSGWKPGGRTPLAFFPDLLDAEVRRSLPELLRPTKNNRSAECVLDGELLRAALDGA